MSVKIEILDYKHIQSNLLTWSNSSVTGWNTGAGITAVSNTSGGSGILIESTAGVSAQFGGFSSDYLTMQNNHSYTFTYTCTDLDNAGVALSRIFIKGVGGGVNGYRPFGSENITIGTHSYTFTIDTSQNNNVGTMDIYFQLTEGNLADKQVKIKDVSLVDNSVLGAIDWNNSIVGELDVTDHSDFPLAMTFQVSDIKDLTSTSGDYSKTFKIPATKNNNKLLKQNYIANIDTNVNVNENKKCRILVNNLYSLKGLIKVTGVGGYGEKPSYYNCVFYGNNISWANDLSGKYMDESALWTDGLGLEYNKTSIIATWDDEDCNSSTSPLVYPITSYGKFNADGEPRTIQLLDTANGAGIPGANKIGYYGYDNSYYHYATPIPSPDWRPAIFIKDTIEKIFRNVGYSIDSTFMETDMFKKLVWLLPNFKYNNPEDRYSQYSAEATWDTAIALTEFELLYDFDGSETDGQYDTTYVDLGTIPTNFTLSPTTSDTDISYIGGANGFSIAEYGFYNIRASGFSAQLSNLLKDGSAVSNQQIFGNVFPSLYIYTIRFKLQVKTTGQTSWNTIDIAHQGGSYGFFGTPLATGVGNAGGYYLLDASSSFDWDVTTEIDLEGLWLNKDDSIRIAFDAKFIPPNWNPLTNIADPSIAGEWSFDVIPTIGKFDIAFAPERVEYGQTYDLDKVINPDYEQLDFIKGVSHAFNLKMTTDETARIVHIEPFNTFYKDFAEAIDWTYKLDRSQKTEDKWVKSDLKRDIVFTYKEDSNDEKVKISGEKWWGGIPDQYPYTETLPKTFEKGESKYENPFFAGTFNGHDQDTLGDTPSTQTTILNPYSACLWAENTYETNVFRPDKGFEFLPRLLYWNKYSPVSSVGQKFARTQTWASTLPYITADASASTSFYLSVIYPQATSINRDDSSSPILSYGNVNVRDYDDATGVYTSYEAGKGLFDTYYKTMFEMLKAKPRLRVVYIDLKVVDIINLDFTKLVYIDGVYWRINRVIDYQPNKNQSTKVELIEWMQLGTFAATAPPFGATNNTGWGVGTAGDDDPVPDDPWGSG